jgi:hypothetical protein
VSHIYVSAHEDDDLIFMSPSLAEDLRRLRVTTVYITAGEAGNTYASYWRGREEGIKAAYGVMLGGVRWEPSSYEVAGREIAVFSATGGRVRLLFLRVPDGSSLVKEVPPSRTLQRLWDGEVEEVGSLDGANTYSRQGLIQTIAAIMWEEEAEIVSIHDSEFGPTGCDHIDHYYSGVFAQEAQLLHEKPHTLRLFRGYSVDLKPQNISDEWCRYKRMVFEAYARHDPFVGKPLSRLYDGWLRRSYYRERRHDAEYLQIEARKGDEAGERRERPKLESEGE